MAENYDFYGMGLRYAEEGTVDLSKMAKELEAKYGAEARLEFEAGVSDSVSVYRDSEFIDSILGDDMSLDSDGFINGTTNFGVDNRMNDSYVDGNYNGVSRRF